MSQSGVSAGSEIVKRSPVETVLFPRVDEFQRLLPARALATADRLVKQAVVAALKNPDIAKCSPLSIVLAVSQVAELGLDLSSPLGLAYLVPFKGSCTLIIGYKGLVELAYRNGVVRSIEARCAYESDTFEVEFGTTPRIRHVPSGQGGALVAVYAVAHLSDGGMQFELMWAAQVEKVRAAAFSANSPAWKGHYDEMAKKTVVRRLLKLIPLSPEIRKMYEFEDAAEVEVNHDGAGDDPTPARPSRNLAAAVREKRAGENAPQAPTIEPDGLGLAADPEADNTSSDAGGGQDGCSDGPEADEAPAPPAARRRPGTSTGDADAEPPATHPEGTKAPKRGGLFKP